MNDNENISHCLCNVKPCVINNTSNNTWSIGCMQSFFRRAKGQKECALRPCVIETESRESAIAMWNTMIEEKTQMAEA